MHKNIYLEKLSHYYCIIHGIVYTSILTTSDVVSTYKKQTILSGYVTFIVQACTCSCLTTYRFPQEQWIRQMSEVVMSWLTWVVKSFKVTENH